MFGDAESAPSQSCVASDCPISCRGVSVASGSRRHPAFQSCLGLRSVSMRDGCGVGRGRLWWRICAWMLIMLQMQAVAQACLDPQQSAMMSMFWHLALAPVESITFLLSSDRLTPSFACHLCMRAACHNGLAAPMLAYGIGVIGW